MKTAILFRAMVVLLVGVLSGCGVSSALRLSDRQTIPIERMVEEVSAAQIIFVGEIHDNPAHHAIQYRVIKGIHAKGRPLAIGLEMFYAESQPELDAWVEGRLDPARFAALYAQNWTEPLELYAPIFQYARDNRIPLVGLNVPRELIQEVKRHGFQALPEEMRRKLPPNIGCEVSDEYLVFMGRVLPKHGGNGEVLSHFCEAMTLWNSLMARNLAAYLEKHAGTTMVVLAGVSHARKTWGIPAYLERVKTPFDYRVILPKLPNIAGLPEVTGTDADYLTGETNNAFLRQLLGDLQ